MIFELCLTNLKKKKTTQTQANQKNPCMCVVCFWGIANKHTFVNH